MRNPLAVFAVILGGFQLFFQMAEAQGLVAGRWWSLAAVAIAAAVLTVNGYMHAYQQERGKQQDAQVDIGTAPVLPVPPAPMPPAGSIIPPVGSLFPLPNTSIKTLEERMSGG